MHKGAVFVYTQNNLYPSEGKALKNRLFIFLGKKLFGTQNFLKMSHEDIGCKGYIKQANQDVKMKVSEN